MCKDNTYRYFASKADCSVCALKVRCTPVQAVRKIARHVHEDARDRARAIARAAAVQLLAPLVVARLHQDRLGGRASNPLDVEAMLDQQAAAFVRGYATPPDGGA